MSTDKSKHVFGSESDVDSALEQGLIDAYDILFLSDGRVGWIDKDGHKVIPETKKQIIALVDQKIEEALKDCPGSGGNAEDGATFTPYVDEEGNLSWSNDRGLENPETVNIKGETPEVRILATIETDSNGGARHGVTIEGPEIVDEYGIIMNEGTIWDGADGKPGLSIYMFDPDKGLSEDGTLDTAFVNVPDGYTVKQNDLLLASNGDIYLAGEERNNTFGYLIRRTATFVFNIKGEHDSDGNDPCFVVQDTAPEDTSVLWVDLTDNSDHGFQEAVNTALAQAKESGQFDGDDYVLTFADKEEIAELAAEMVEVPESSGGNDPCFVVQDTAPEDTSVLWVDLSDDTEDEVPNSGGNADVEKLNAISSISIEYGRYEGASYYLARIPRYTIDGKRIKPRVAITSVDGSVDGAKVSALAFAKRENAIFTINAGLFNTQTKQPQGQTIIDGVSVTNTPMTDDMGTAISDDECYPLCISTDGDLSAPYERSVDTADMLADRVIYAVTAWGQFIENYAKSDSSKYNEIVHPGKYVRQAVGQYQNGDYFVCTVDGIKGIITENEAGMTYDTLANLLISKGAKFAYSLDGGGSAETVIGNRQINPIFEGVEGRKVPTVLYFTTDEYPEVDFPVKQTILYELPEATTFDGTSYIDTGVMLYDIAKDFSIVIDCSMDTQSANDLQVFSCVDHNAAAGIKFAMFGSWQKYTIRPGTNANGAAVIQIPDGVRTKMVVTVKSGIISGVKYCQSGGSIVAPAITPVETYTKIEKTLLLGAGYYYGTIDKYWTGTVYDFKVYNYALSDDEITAYLS